MIRTEIQNIDDLFRIVSDTKKIDLHGYEIGCHNFNEVNLRKATTQLVLDHGAFSIEGDVFCGSHITAEFVSLEGMVKTVEQEYEVISASKTQLILKKDNTEYALNQTEYSINISVKGHRNWNKEKFSSTLQNHSDLLTKCATEQLKAKEIPVPDLIYYVGRNVNINVFIKEPKLRDDSFLDFFNPKSNNEKADKLERKIDVGNPKVYFDQIGGCSRGKEEMIRIARDIRNPETARFFGRDPDKSKGYLLLGSAGCGKTLLVKALATMLKEELGDKIKCYAINYEDITSIYRGGEAQATGMIFDLVKRNEELGIKTLLFLDEIHLIGTRSDRTQPKDEALDTLITHLDGIRTYKGLTLIGATYLPVESLDPALTRDGRLGIWIKIEKPNYEERKEILGIHIEQRNKIAASAGNANLFENIDLDQIATATPDFNGSHIYGLISMVVAAKEDDTLRNAGAATTNGNLFKAFAPITTEYVLNAILAYQKVERTRPVGFRQEK